MSNFMGNMVAQLIGRKLEEFRKKMTAAGLQRWTLAKYETKYSLEDANLFNMKLLLENVVFTGATKYVTEELHFDPVTSELSCNLVVPKLYVSVGNLFSNMEIFKKECQGQLRGSVTIKKLRVIAKMKMDMNQNGMDVKIISQETSVENIQSNVKLVVLGFDLSFLVDNFMTNMLPLLLTSFMDYLKKPIEAVLKFSFDRQFQDMF